MSSFKKTIISYFFVFIFSANVSAYTRIEAENYSTMSGIQYENANTTIGFIDAGDWIHYRNVDFGTGPSSVILSVAKASTGGSIEMRIDGITGPLISTFYPTSTNSWTAFVEQSCKVNNVSGIHDLYFLAKDVNGVCNIDYFIFSDTKIYEPNWVLQWSDEFDGVSLDETTWTKFYDGNPHNGELQFYTPRSENIDISNGTLKLIARKEIFTAQGPYMSQPVTRYYTSGKVETQGKMTFQYGKFEAKMKLPRGKGSWPAFWMLGENMNDSGIGWPRCGEIDIMEHGQDFNNLGAAIHTQAYNHTIGTQKTGTYNIDNYDTEFHVYGLEWNSEKLSFHVDGNFYFTVTKATLGSTEAQWPFDQPFWIILNHAVGGAWGGTPDDTKFPMTTEIDWVRIYSDQQTTTRQPLLQSEDILVYPNPAENILTLTLNNFENSENHKYEVIITDISGKIILNEMIQTQRTKFDIERFSRGVYLISVITDKYKSKTSIFTKK